MSKKSQPRLGSDPLAWIKDTRIEESSEQQKVPESEVLNIDIDLIDPNPMQPRQHFDRQALQELASSIKQQKVIQPIVVRKIRNRFQVVAGERRLRAARMAKIPKLPAVVRDLSDKEVLEISLIENLQRESLNPFEEAEIFQQIIDHFGYTQEELGRRIGKSKQFINDRLRLLSLSRSAKEKLSARADNISQLRKVVGLPPEQQEAVSDFIVKNDPTVKEVDVFIKRLNKPKKRRQRKTKLETTMEQLEEISEKVKSINFQEVSLSQREKLKQQIESFIVFLLSVKEKL